MKNNKGFTIAELLVTFVLVMSIVLALFKVVDHYRERQQNATSAKETNSYRNQIVKVVEDDILFNCGGRIEIIFNKLDAKDNKITKKLIVRKSGISYGGMFYEFPSKFVSAVDDVIYTETQVENVSSDSLLK